MVIFYTSAYLQFSANMVGMKMVHMFVKLHESSDFNSILLKEKD